MISKKRILIVEDDPNNLDLLVDYLSFLSYETVAAKNGAEALAAVETHKPDIVLMDINMPVMNGLDATKLLKSNKEYCHLPVVAVSAQEWFCTEAEQIKSGFACCLAKPINFCDLKKTIQLLLA